MKILFICKNNQYRSQMAAALYNRLTGTDDADSAGTYVGSDAVPEGSAIEQYFRKPDFFEFMEEKGMSLRGNRTKKLTPALIEQAERVISMADEPFTPDFLRDNERVERWDIEDPHLVTREVAEGTFSRIEPLVRELISDVRSQSRE